MKDEIVHLTDAELQSMLDDTLAGTDRRRVEQHLAVCSRCNAAFANLRSIDTALEGQLIVATRSDFTRAVMSTIMPEVRQSRTYKAVEKAAYLFSLLIVLAIMIAAFLVTGVFQSSDFNQTRTVAGAMIEKTGDAIGSTVTGFTAILVEYLPFAFGKGSMNVGLFAIVVIAMIAVVDRLIGKRVLQK
jgi:predicted anti-sigma-YlaC factor YlaD